MKTWGGDFVNAREIARRAGGKRKFHQDPDWAKPILLRMEERGILESNIQGHFRIKPLPKEKQIEPQRVAPAVPRLLHESRAAFEGEGIGDSSDDYYEQL
ncbi:MAG TPA: hypothetical protein VFY06_14185 [Verrucomicrobiae bacterium]|nr:hypothetical protein [Verrucomicrobiae bacterium]